MCGHGAAEGVKGALIDLLDVLVDLSPAEQVFLGAYTARRLRCLDGVATVVPQPLRVGAGEAAAGYIGLKLRTFTSRADAEEWMLEMPPA